MHTLASRVQINCLSELDLNSWLQISLFRKYIDCCTNRFNAKLNVTIASSTFSSILMQQNFKSNSIAISTNKKLKPLATRKTLK